MGELPVCVSKWMIVAVFLIELFVLILEAGCEEGGMADISHGEAVREEDGAVYRYKTVDSDGKRRHCCAGTRDRKSVV